MRSDKLPLILPNDFNLFRSSTIWLSQVWLFLLCVQNGNLEVASTLYMSFGPFDLQKNEAEANIVNYPGQLILGRGSSTENSEGECLVSSSARLLSVPLPLQPHAWHGINGSVHGNDRGWDGCMASPTQWTWVWVNSRSWWWTGRPGVLQSKGSQRVGHDWAGELNYLLNRTDGKQQWYLF